MYLENKRWCFFLVLPIFDGVIMDGHPIFWVVDAGVVGFHHDTRCPPQFLVRIVLFLHFIGRIYLSKILLHHFIGFIWIITPLMKINVLVQETRFVTRVNSVCVRMRHAVRSVHVRYSNGWSEPMKPLVDKLDLAHWLRMLFISNINEFVFAPCRSITDVIILLVLLRGHYSDS